MKNTNKSVEVIVSAPQGNYRPSRRMHLLKVDDTQKQPSSITVNGKPLSHTSVAKDTGWSFDVKAKTVWISFEDAFKEQKVVVHR